MKFQGEKFKQILILISEGSALRDATKKVKLGNSTFYDWIENNPDLREQYARATNERTNILAEEMIKIADATDNEGVNKARLQVDTRKWLASKLRPKKYGDKTALDVTTKGKELNFTSEEREREIKMLLDKRNADRARTPPTG